jgi:hypothetical protein
LTRFSLPPPLGDGQPYSRGLTDLFRRSILRAPLSIAALSASDTVLVNAHIYTANQKKPWAAAIAVTKDTIDAVG